MAVTRHFHDWNQPCLPTAVSILCQDWVRSGHKGPLDLRHTLIIVPTRHAGRRLRAELARKAAEKGTAVLTGPIVTPDHLLPLSTRVASEPLVTALLAKLLLARHGDFPALLPASDMDWTGDYALGLATQLQDVRRQLAEEDKSAADLPALVPAEERERWNDIARLEKSLLQALHPFGLEDPFHALLQSARQLPAPPSCKRLVALFVPDFSARTVRALQSIAAHCDTEIHILAPATEADRFDTWGRPIPARWENEPLPVIESQIHVFAQAADETDALAMLLQDADRQRKALAVCTPDAENARALALRLQMENRSLYLPNGIPLSSTSPGRLLAAWLALRRTRSYAAIAAFLRHPDAQDWISSQLDSADATSWLSQLDRCQAEHLPATFDDLLRFARADAAGSLLAQVLEVVTRHLDDEILGFLAALYDCRRTATAATADPLFQEAAKALADLVQATTLAARTLELALPDELDLLRTLLPREQIFPRPNTALMRETTGWLEVQWETAPALLLADMREGIVPETRIGDAFLPDSIRAAAGMAGNREAFARDLFLARALLASRPAGGIRFLYSRRALNQDPQLPSRLLLACPDAELPARVAWLFEHPALQARSTALPPRPKLRLNPPPCLPDQVPAVLAVTDFRAYLTCPFRFYLSRILGMAAQDDGARELDPLGFGILAHEALRLLIKHPALEDSEKIRERLLAELDRLARQRFGSRPSMAILVQLESLRQRLGAAAEIQAAAVREGWRIISAEETFEAELDGMLLRARLDRIDRHVEDGRIRILDYKTTDAGADPGPTHYQPRKQKWLDLQLPLYRYLYERSHPKAIVSAGYFNLPKAVTDTRIAEFQFQARDGTDLYPAAVAAAQEVIAGIRARLFWPPVAQPADQDEFALIFAGDPPLIGEVSAP